MTAKEAALLRRQATLASLSADPEMREGGAEALEAGARAIESLSETRAELCRETNANREILRERDSARSENERLREVAKGYETWEAQLILDNSAWDDEFPRLSDELFDGLMRLQALRNEALTTPPAAREPSELEQLRDLGRRFFAAWDDDNDRVWSPLLDELRTAFGAPPPTKEGLDSVDDGRIERDESGRPTRLYPYIQGEGGGE